MIQQSLKYLDSSSTRSHVFTKWLRNCTTSYCPREVNAHLPIEFFLNVHSDFNHNSKKNRNNSRHSVGRWLSKLRFLRLLNMAQQYREQTTKR